MAQVIVVSFRPVVRRRRREINYGQIGCGFLAVMLLFGVAAIGALLNGYANTLIVWVAVALISSPVVVHAFRKLQAEQREALELKRRRAMLAHESKEVAAQKEKENQERWALELKRRRELLEDLKSRVSLLADATDLPFKVVADSVGLSKYYATGVFAPTILDDVANLEQRVARDGAEAVKVTDWKMAEHVAARWMRAHGWPDAEVTTSGADAGVDVRATGAVAQVKWFTTTRVGRPALQQIVGAAGPDDEVFFFARADAGNGKPYSSEAIAFSKDANVQLLVIERLGLVREV